MRPEDIKKLLEDVSAGRKKPDEAFENLRDLPFSDIEIAKLDLHRPMRNGFSEVIFCEGKHVDHLIRIIDDIDGRGHNLFGTRANKELLDSIKDRFPKVQIDEVSRTFRLINQPMDQLTADVAILCAGTADVQVAEEARQTIQFFGVEPKRYYDVGVAGLHRILKTANELRDIDCAIVVAGMEGALPTVVGGLTKAPIVAVPTSIGYGASFGGVAALLGMLNSCSEGITVVNIDNGFGAACAALRIVRRG
ncbi:MAG: nickel pincer cofactor biosynthesis protein LarB [Deltaproteobacteria bacterium]|jgi:pyridinium-3,5-biscarboxylic acid mononucleotide synthase|nr:nickel pincer cofactor biosynthesis protein LarB [Deltaproteobacteria bacterium]